MQNIFEKLLTKEHTFWKTEASNITIETGLYIDGDFQNSIDGGTYQSINPATGKIITDFASATKCDVDYTVASAKAAFDSIYGLGASIWTTNISKAHTMVQQIEAGNIWLNCYGDGDVTQQFGGYKQSGNGRDRGMQSLLSYTQTKSIWLKL